MKLKWVEVDSHFAKIDVYCCHSWEQISKTAAFNYSQSNKLLIYLLSQLKGCLCDPTTLSKKLPQPRDSKCFWEVLFSPPFETATGWAGLWLSKGGRYHWDVGALFVSLLTLWKEQWVSTSSFCPHYRLFKTLNACLLNASWRKSCALSCLEQNLCAICSSVTWCALITGQDGAEKESACFRFLME